MYGKTIREVLGIFISLSGDDLKPLRQYLYCKASRFPHFYFVYNEICEYKQQLDTENAMPKNLMIKIELVGEFTDDDLQLLPKGKVAYLIILKYLKLLSFNATSITKIKQHECFIGILNKTKKKDENIWEAIPLLCFQNDVALNSALEVGYHEMKKSNNGEKKTIKRGKRIVVLGKLLLSN